MDKTVPEHAEGIAITKPGCYKKDREETLERKIIMTQWDYDTICATLKFGAPALAGQLIKSIDDILTEYNELKKAQMKAPLEEKPSETN